MYSRLSRKHKREPRVCRNREYKSLYRAYSLTWPAAMQIYWNKRKFLRFSTCSRVQGVRPEKKMVDGKQVEDYWASSKKVRYVSWSFDNLVSSNEYIEHRKGLLMGWCKLKRMFKGSRDGAVVRALASHQCGPGSIPGLGVICGLSLLLVLVLAPRGFSPGTPVFPSPQKPTFLNSNSIWKVSPISAVRAKYI